ncbi:hypothetical protein [Marinivivus vitaminiproducens]|uniref:hypothetical protein n=1 Tax=Marinivivus vitaminiproducens TaxID=3035935 RepID=UPI00279C98B9|nr:hypothetical protein P4R82_05610 [Geminicoccaceae bacterium SCSIO 64248]
MPERRASARVPSRTVLAAGLIAGVLASFVPAAASADTIRVADRRVSPAACLAALHRTIGQLGPSVVSVAEIERSAALRVTRIETRASALLITCDSGRERLLIERIGWSGVG